MIKIREIFTFNISFIDVINILTVGSKTVSSYYARDWQLTAWTDFAGNHSHNVGMNNTGSSQAHNNIQPYIAVYIWQRKS